nr:helix-turn-helix transcriptional regulator [Clostridium beijerinckii]
MYRGGIVGVKNKLLEIRLQLGYKKQKDFADYIGVSQVSYNKWENNSNQPSLEMVLKISNKLNLKIDEIVYLEKENGF